MHTRSFLVMTAVAGLVACGHGTGATPTNTPVPFAPSAPTIAPATTLSTAPRDWQLLDETTDHVPGISVDLAKTELLAGKSPKATIIVAVLDGGVDTAHAALRPNLWTNPRETPNNGKDDDGNGYVDDIHGWDFIGGPHGDVHWDAYEVTRLAAQCARGQAAADSLPPWLAGQCPAFADTVKKKHDETARNLEQIHAVSAAISQASEILRASLGDGPLTTERVRALTPRDSASAEARALFLRLADVGITPAAVAEYQTALQNGLDYSLNLSFDPRSIVGDRYNDVSQSHYGNNDVTGPDAKHGTHVSGIIAAVKRDSAGIEGIASAVRIMAIRAVPDGDERDKDIANGIRYAVDNGAKIINMSFGKGYSPYKGAVDAAVKYADAHGVLMVHAAGNDGQDLATAKNFPTPVYLDGGRAKNWIEVGASSWKGGDSLAASFSNYGQHQVDVFAPGVDILSTIPGNSYERDSGTSMAAPVVSGLAALIWSYHPELTAAEVKQIIVQSATRYTAQTVVRPGSKDAEVPFGSLSESGGVVNADAALRMAAAMHRR
jgi:subtilisin family serine protease